MSGRAHLGVYALFVALVALYTWPLARDLAHLLPDNTDPRLFGWVMLTIFRNLTTDPRMLFDGNAFYPLGLSLTLAEPLLTPALLAGSIFHISGNPVLAYNVTLVVFWALSGWATYAVTYRLTGSHPGALVAGVIFVLSPPRIDYYLEFQMQMTFGVPLAVYALIRFLEEQRVRYLVALLGVFWLQAIAVWYYAVILGLGLTALALQYALLHWRGWRARALVGAGLGGVALVAGLIPVAWPFFVIRRELGFERAMQDAATRSADVLTYVATRTNWLYRGTSSGHLTETTLFVGFGALALVALSLLWLGRQGGLRRGLAARGLGWAVWAGLGLAVLALATRGRVHVGPFRTTLVFPAIAAGVVGVVFVRHAAEGWRRWRDGVDRRRLTEREWVGVLLGLAAVAFLLSLGPEIRLGGRPLGSGPYAWLFPYFLPLHAIRWVTRVGLLTVFAAALLAAFGLTWLLGRLPVRARAPVTAGVVLVLLLEYMSAPLSYGRVSTALRPVDEVLRADPRDVAVLEWPTNTPGVDADAKFRSVGHGKRVMNGFAGFVPNHLVELSDLLTRPGPPYPVPEAEAALRRIYPLRYLLVRLEAPELAPAWRSWWRALREAPPPLLRFRGTFEDVDLYEVAPLPERGEELERWVSYDLLAARPRLRFALRPLVRREDLEQTVEILLNGRSVDRVRADGEVRASILLEPPYSRAAPNVITLRHGYLRRSAASERYRIGTTGVLSPGDLTVRSAGQPYGSPSSIVFNGVELSPNRRGYNLVALDPVGRILGARAFDTFLRADATPELAGWVAALPAGTIVAGAVRDEGSAQLGAAAVAALRTLGVAGDLRGRFRESHAFVGIKGAPPGSAPEALEAQPVTVVVGRPEPGLGVELTEFSLEARVAGRR